eukprot:g17344.t1
MKFVVAEGIAKEKCINNQMKAKTTCQTAPSSSTPAVTLAGSMLVTVTDPVTFLAQPNLQFALQDAIERMAPESDFSDVAIEIPSSNSLANKTKMVKVGFNASVKGNDDETSDEKALGAEMALQNISHDALVDAVNGALSSEGLTNLVEDAMLLLAPLKLKGPRNLSHKDAEALREKHRSTQKRLSSIMASQEKMSQYIEDAVSKRSSQNKEFQPSSEAQELAHAKANLSSTKAELAALQAKQVKAEKEALQALRRQSAITQRLKANASRLALNAAIAEEELDHLEEQFLSAQEAQERAYITAWTLGLFLGCMAIVIVGLSTALFVCMKRRMKESEITPITDAGGNSVVVGLQGLTGGQCSSSLNYTGEPPVKPELPTLLTSSSSLARCMESPMKKPKEVAEGSLQGFAAAALTLPGQGHVRSSRICRGASGPRALVATKIPTEVLLAANHGVEWTDAKLPYQRWGSCLHVGDLEASADLLTLAVCSGALFAAGAGLQRHRWQLPSPRLRPKEWLAKAQATLLQEPSLHDARVTRITTWKKRLLSCGHDGQVCLDGPEPRKAKLGTSRLLSLAILDGDHFAVGAEDARAALKDVTGRYYPLAGFEPATATQHKAFAEISRPRRSGLDGGGKVSSRLLEKFFCTGRVSTREDDGFALLSGPQMPHARPFNLKDLRHCLLLERDPRVEGWTRDPQDERDYNVSAVASFFHEHGFVVLEKALPELMLENLKNASGYIMRRIFEEDPEGSFGGGAGKLPHRYSLGPTFKNEYQSLHPDAIWGVLEGPVAEQEVPPAVTINFVLEPLTALNGAMRVVPGSHRWPERPPHLLEEWKVFHEHWKL